MKKYEFTGETKTINLSSRTVTLHRIKAVVEFGLVKVGELGGWIEKEENLSHKGDAWVSGDAVVRENAEVSGNAVVSGDAVVRENAWVRVQSVLSSLFSCFQPWTFSPESHMILIPVPTDSLNQHTSSRISLKTPYLLHIDTSASSFFPTPAR